MTDNNAPITGGLPEGFQYPTSTPSTPTQSTDTGALGRGMGGGDYRMTRNIGNAGQVTMHLGDLRSQLGVLTTIVATRKAALIQARRLTSMRSISPADEPHSNGVATAILHSNDGLSEALQIDVQNWQDEYDNLKAAIDDMEKADQHGASGFSF
jgi:hypothetical protein